jgi:hypothetical protein
MEPEGGYFDLMGSPFSKWKEKRVTCFFNKGGVEFYERT